MRMEVVCLQKGSRWPTPRSHRQPFAAPTHTVMPISSALLSLSRAGLRYNLIALEFFFLIWARRLHRPLTYSLHLALLTQRTAEMQTGGGGPVRQLSDAAWGPSEWEQILAHETRVRVIPLLFCSHHIAGMWWNGFLIFYILNRGLDGCSRACCIR